MARRRSYDTDKSTRDMLGGVTGIAVGCMLEGMGIMGLGEATSNPAAVSVALAVGAVAAGGGILLIGRGAEQIEQFGSAESSPNDEMDVSEGQGDVE